MTTSTTDLSPAQARAISAIASHALELARRGYTEDEARTEAANLRNWGRPTMRCLRERGLIEEQADRYGRLCYRVTDEGLRAGDASPELLADAAERGCLERQEEREADERADAENRAKWMRLSAAFDGITYDDWQYVTGPVPNQDLGENVRDSLGSVTSPFRNGGTGLTIRVEALEQIAERILALRAHVSGLEAAEDALDGGRS